MIKNLCYLVVLSALLMSCKTQSNVVSESSPSKSNKEVNKRELVEKEDYPAKDPKVETSTTNSHANELPLLIVESARENIGVRYKTSGTTKEGMDCSGLVWSTFRKFNLNIPRTSELMSKEGEYIVSRDAKPGDLIFFRTGNTSRINHVGIVVETTRDYEIKFVHSSSSRGVIESSTSQSYWKRTFAEVRRIKY